MRTKWLLIALPLAILALLLQSSLWVPTYASQAKGNPRRLVTFLRASIGEPKQLNPMISSDYGASQIMDDNIFEGLVTADENLKLVPKLAESWELSEDAYVAVLPQRRLKDGSAVTGARSKLFLAAGARFKPISATIAPVTIGGISRLIHSAPNFCTTAPISASTTPASTTPPKAPATPYCCWDAMMGAMNAKLDPR